MLIPKPTNLQKLILTKPIAAGVLAATDEASAVIVEHFQTRQGSWKPLAAQTVKERLAHGFGGAAPILVRSGTLARYVAAAIGVKVDALKVTGSVRPDSSAKADYSDEPIAAYAARLNTERPFYDIEDSQEIQRLNEAFRQAFKANR